MKGKSLAAAYLCKWINNIVIYNRIYKRVKPLMDTAEEAERLANEKESWIGYCVGESQSH